MLAAPLLAQEPLRLADAVRQALAVSPLLASGAARVAQAEGLRQQASLTLNPRLFLQSENTRFGNGSQPFVYSRSTDNFLYASQVFETGGKRERRVEVAAQAVQRVQREGEAVRRQVIARVAEAYWTAVGAGRVRDLLRQDVVNFEQIVEYHRHRVREGAAAEVDLIRVQLERDRLEVEAQVAAREAERTRITLFREMGRTDDPAATLVEPLDGEARVPDVPDAEALARRPELAAAQAAVAEAESGVRLQQAYAKPDPEVLFGYKRTGGLDTVIGGVQVNLPVRNRNQGQIAAAVAGVRVAGADLAATEVAVRAELAVARAEFASRRKLVDTLGPVRERAVDNARIAEAAYREGGTDLLRLLDAERVRIETEALFVRTLAEYRRSAALLRVALGEEP